MLLAFEWPEDMDVPRPGQFFTFRPGVLDPGESTLLRRPLAFAGYDGPHVYSIYQLRGAGTKALARANPGTRLDVIAPLGNFFPPAQGSNLPVLAGGGIGTGPLLFLAATIRQAAAENFPGAEPPFKLFLGFRDSSFVPDFGFVKDLDMHSASGISLASGVQNLAVEVGRAEIATDDGSGGFRGSVVDAVREWRDKRPPDDTRRIEYYACGPSPMLAAIDSLASESGQGAHVSVEQWMACGVGACHGCVVPTRSGTYLRACADGPVFNSGDLSWEQ